MKMCQMEAEFFYADVQADMTKLTVTYSNYIYIYIYIYIKKPVNSFDGNQPLQLMQRFQVRSQNCDRSVVAQSCLLAHPHIYRESQEERTKHRESVPYVKLYRYNPKHLYPKLNGYGDNGQKKVWTSCISA